MATAKPVKSVSDQASAKTKAVAALRVKPIGTLIDEIFNKREDKRRLEAQVKEIEGEIAGLEEYLLERMDAEKTDKGSGKLAGASISTNVVGNVTDWDKLWTYIFKYKASHLMQRRLSDTAYRELLEHKGTVPGVEPFSKRRVNIRVLSK